MLKPEILFSYDLRELASKLTDYGAVYVVADKKLWETYTEKFVLAMVKCGVRIKGVTEIEASEKNKNLKTVEKIHRFLIANGADRDALILALGGGITTDLAGFAAATYKRGVIYVNVPTTFLAMVDASIGGKTGCNVGGYKNMCGAFLMPEFTFINPGFLMTLPHDEYVSGLAEMVKTFIIGDAAAYREVVNVANFALTVYNLGPLEQKIEIEQIEKLAPLIQRAAAIKADIVAKDFKENGKRRLLNLGHTFAHAIEYKSKGKIPHGHAVAMGMIMAAAKSEKEGVAAKTRGKVAKDSDNGAKGLTARLTEDFKKIGLPTESPWSEKQLSPVMKTDKKAAGGKIKFILIQRPGRCLIKEL